MLGSCHGSVIFHLYRYFLISYGKRKDWLTFIQYPLILSPSFRHFWVMANQDEWILVQRSKGWGMKTNKPIQSLPSQECTQVARWKRGLVSRDSCLMKVKCELLLKKRWVRLTILGNFCFHLLGIVMVFFFKTTFRSIFVFTYVKVCVCLCLCDCMLRVCRGQKRVLDPLDLWL